MPAFLFLIPPACLLIASILLLRPLLFDRARRIVLFRPVNLARPTITPLDGCVMMAVVLIFFALNFFGERSEKAAQPSPTSLFLLLLCYLLWIAPAAAILLRQGASLADTFGIDRETAWRNIRLGLRYGLMMLFPVFAASILTHLMFGFFNLPVKPQNMLLQLVDPATPVWLRALLGVLAVTLIPIVEEAAFRGVLFPAFARAEPFPTLLLCQALLFSLIHFNAVAAPALFVVGVCLGLGYARTRSLLTPIAMHAVLNLYALLNVLLYNLVKIYS